MLEYRPSKINAKNADHRAGVDDITSCQVLHTSMNGHGVSSTVIIRVFLVCPANETSLSLGFVIAKLTMRPSISCIIRARLATDSGPELDSSEARLQ